MGHGETQQEYHCCRICREKNGICTYYGAAGTPVGWYLFETSLLGWYLLNQPGHKTRRRVACKTEIHFSFAAVSKYIALARVRGREKRSSASKRIGCATLAGRAIRTVKKRGRPDVDFRAKKSASANRRVTMAVCANMTAW